MKVFKRVSMLICVVSVVTLFSMTVLATANTTLCFPYNVKDGDDASTSYTNTTSQPLTVEVKTTPDVVGGIVKVEINKYNPRTDAGIIASQYFPYSPVVPPISFNLPAQTTYYVYISTYLSTYVSGILEVSY